MACLEGMYRRPWSGCIAQRCSRFVTWSAPEALSLCRREGAEPLQVLPVLLYVLSRVSSRCCLLGPAGAIKPRWVKVKLNSLRITDRLGSPIHNTWSPVNLIKTNCECEGVLLIHLNFMISQNIMQRNIYSNDII